MGYVLKRKFIGKRKNFEKSASYSRKIDTSIKLNNILLFKQFNDFASGINKARFAIKAFWFLTVI